MTAVHSYRITHFADVVLYYDFLFKALFFFTLLSRSLPSLSILLRAERRWLPPTAMDCITFLLNVVVATNSAIFSLLMFLSRETIYIDLF